MPHSNNTQTILIGLGGTGGHIISNVVRELNKNGISRDDNGIFCAVLDSHHMDISCSQTTGIHVPAFVTGRHSSIGEYFRDYAQLHIEEWCPQSPAFLAHNMLSGAAGLRLTSRIAFMDYLKSGRAKEIEQEINRFLNNNVGSRVQVIIVSTLSGSTGSGMFIQVALWLRKLLADYSTTIRGIFMLPDVLISNLRDVGANRATIYRHYSNTYAAIRELNALDKIMKGTAAEPEEPIVIDGLFDSRTDGGSGRAIYDFAFLIDNIDENGVTLNSVAEYEQMVAQLVYMQIHASVFNTTFEDNTFLSYIRAGEPLYGSCGTARAVYPAESVKAYCAIRAAQDALSIGWKKIDAEIADRIRLQQQRLRDGEVRADKVDEQAEFIRLFECETGREFDEVGADSFFISLENQVNDDTRSLDDGNLFLVREDKVAVFLKHLEQKISTVAKINNGTDSPALDSLAFMATDHSANQLRALIENDSYSLEKAIHCFEAQVPNLADEIVNELLPYHMHEVNPEKEGSVYSLLSKSNEMGGHDFIHPLAARYVLYKLLATIRTELELIDCTLDKCRHEAIVGGHSDIICCGQSTITPAEDPAEYLKRKPWYVGEAAFLREIKNKYVDFINRRVSLIQRYDTELLLREVYRNLIKRLDELARRMRDFFCDLDRVQAALADALAQNIRETAGAAGRTLYVFADQEAKESVYQAMRFDLRQSDARINKRVIDTIYGQLCANKCPHISDNSAYLDMDPANVFLQETLAAFRSQIENDDGNRQAVEMDIFAAIGKEADLRFGGNAFRHRDAFEMYKDRLRGMGAPFLRYNRAPWDADCDTMPIRDAVVWSYHPDLDTVYPGVKNALGVWADVRADVAYPRNALYCYRAVYGLEAARIPNFNEGGIYYAAYKHDIDAMIADAEGRQGDLALVRTPHLDKRWHKLLPHIADKPQD